MSSCYSYLVIQECIHQLIQLSMLDLALLIRHTLVPVTILPVTSSHPKTQTLLDLKQKGLTFPFALLAFLFFASTHAHDTGKKNPRQQKRNPRQQKRKVLLVAVAKLLEDLSAADITVVEHRSSVPCLSQ